MEIEKATSEEYSIWIYERKKCLDLSRSWDDRADEKEEEVRYFFFSKIMKMYKSNKKKKKRFPFESAWSSNLKKSSKEKKKRKSFKKFALFNSTYSYYSIAEFILAPLLAKLGERSPNRKSDKMPPIRPTVGKCDRRGTFELWNGRDKFGIGDLKRD